MHPLDVVFWVFFTAAAAFIGWSFIRMSVEMLSDRQHMRRGVAPSSRESASESSIPRRLQRCCVPSARAKAALTSGVSLLVQRVNRLEGDKDRLEWARRLALVAQQHETVLRLGAFEATAPRDVAMTENTLWVLGRLAKGERAVYWTHNAHV